MILEIGLNKISLCLGFMKGVNKMIMLKSILKERIKIMTASEIRKIKFEECKCCFNDDECLATTVEHCRKIILNTLNLD